MDSRRDALVRDHLLLVDHVVRRHPILRTALALTEYSEPLQLVYRHAVLPVGEAVGEFPRHGDDVVGLPARPVRQLRMRLVEGGEPAPEAAGGLDHRLDPPVPDQGGLDMDPPEIPADHRSFVGCRRGSISWCHGWT